MGDHCVYERKCGAMRCGELRPSPLHPFDDCSRPFPVTLHSRSHARTHTHTHIHKRTRKESEREMHVGEDADDAGE